MDVGDLLVLIFIVSGILSSLVGGKKKKPVPPARRPRPTPGTPQPTAGPRAERPRPSLDPAHPSPVPSQMEQILRQLGLEVEPEVEEKAPPEPPPPPKVEVDAVGRVLPRAVSLEEPARPTVVPDTEKRHERFHDDYVRAYHPTEVAHEISRGHEILNPKSLRQAILVHEILGPPKGLR